MRKLYLLRRQNERAKFKYPTKMLSDKKDHFLSDNIGSFLSDKNDLFLSDDFISYLMKLTTNKLFKRPFLLGGKIPNKDNHSSDDFGMNVKKTRCH